MRSNLKLVVNNPHNKIEEKHFFEKDELKIILDLYAKMVSEGSWKDYGLSISSKQVGFSVFRNATENALYKICKNFKPKNKNLKYLITGTNGKILKNSYDLRNLLKNQSETSFIMIAKEIISNDGKTKNQKAQELVSLEAVRSILKTIDD